MPSEVRNISQISIGDIVIWEMGSDYTFGHAGLVACVYHDRANENNSCIAILHAVGQHPDFPGPHNVIFSLIRVNQFLLEANKVRFYSNIEIAEARRVRRLVELTDININGPDNNPTTSRIREQEPKPTVSHLQTELITTALKIKNTCGGPVYYNPRITQVVTGLPCFCSRAQKRLAKYYDRLQHSSTLVAPTNVTHTPENAPPFTVPSADSLGASISPDLMSPTSTTTIMSPISSNSQSPSQIPIVPEDVTIQSAQRPIVRHLTCTEFVILTYQLAFYNKSKAPGNMFIYRDARNTSPTGLGQHLASTPGWVKYKLRRSSTPATTPPQTATISQNPR